MMMIDFHLQTDEVVGYVTECLATAVDAAVTTGHTVIGDVTQALGTAVDAVSDAAITTAHSVIGEFS